MLMQNYTIIHENEMNDLWRRRLTSVSPQMLVHGVANLSGPGGKRLYSVGSHPTAGDTQAHIRVAVLIYKRLIINYHLVEMFRSL